MRCDQKKCYFLEHTMYDLLKAIQELYNRKKVLIFRSEASINNEIINETGWFGFVWFCGISTTVGYLMSNLFLYI